MPSNSGCKGRKIKKNHRKFDAIHRKSSYNILLILIHVVLKFFLSLIGSISNFLQVLNFELRDRGDLSKGRRKSKFIVIRINFFREPVGSNYWPSCRDQHHHTTWELTTKIFCLQLTSTLSAWTRESKQPKNRFCGKPFFLDQLYNSCLLFLYPFLHPTTWEFSNGKFKVIIHIFVNFEARPAFDKFTLETSATHFHVF